MDLLLESSCCCKLRLPGKQNECVRCGKQCYRKMKQPLLQSTHNEDNFECSKCNMTFSCISKLLLHLTRNCNKKCNRNVSFPKKQIISKTIECAECVGQFYSQIKLRLHINQAHNKDNFVCAVCSKQFKTKKTIRQHITTIHSEKKFGCAECDEQFYLRRKLRLHIKQAHNEDNFVCAICSKQFKTKKTIRQHITTIHSEKKFECSQCNTKFHRKWNLLRHSKNSCNKKSKKYHTHSFKCGLCNSHFFAKKQMQQHLQIDHDVRLSWESLQFDSESDFKQFKLNYQRTTITKFVIRDSHKKVNGTVLYKCHRSGLSEYRKETVKFPQMKGLKKIQSYCPAEMCVKYFKDGKCIVDFQKTHVGHSICDQNELAHIYLDSDEQQEIAAKILHGVPKNIVCMKQLLANERTEEENKLMLLTNQDVQNNVGSFNIQNEFTFPFGDDLINVDAFVEMNATSILFLKKQSEEDTRFNVLTNNDFALILMNEFQEKNLYRYGKNIIAFDGRHGTNPRNFILHTLLVMDINYQGIPAAFLLSNRNDEIIMNIFFQCIKEKLGVFTPRVIMTDMEPTYKNSWVNIMQNEPKFTFWCMWHVKEAWHKNYAKIPAKKRNAVKKIIMEFAHELDPALFQIKLAKFLSNNDEDLTEFISYFRRQYVNNEKSLRWAYCYRKQAGINTNMSMEAFHKTFMHIYGNGKSMNWLSFNLKCIQKYLDTKEISEEIASYIAVRINKLNKLCEKHHEAQKIRNVVDKVHSIDSKSWLVESFKRLNTTYFIEKCEIKECGQYKDVMCRLYCDFCKICFHEYSCNCFDAAIRNNMCKHIHAVGIAQSTFKNRIANQFGENQSIVPTNMREKLLLTKSLNESSYKVEQVEEIVRFRENEIANVTALRKDKQDLRNYFDEILESIHNRQVLMAIKKQFLKPILPTINAFNCAIPKIKFKNEK